MIADNALYAFTAYTLAWAGLLGYVLFLVRHQRRLEQELGELERHLDGAHG